MKKSKEKNFEEIKQLFKNKQYKEVVSELGKKKSLNSFFLLIRSKCFLELENIIEGLKDCDAILSETKIEEEEIRAEAIVLKSNLLIDNNQSDLAIKLLSSNANTFEQKNLLTNLLKEKEDQSKIPENEIYIFNLLCNELLNSGSIFSKVGLKYYSQGYRGIYATKRIKKGEIFLSIPHKFMLTLDKAKESLIGKKLRENSCKLQYPNNSNLTILLMQEMDNSNSIWNNYFPILPKKLNSFPILYESKELEILEGTDFKLSIEEYKKDLKTDYEEICRCAPEFRKFELIEFEKTRVLVNSRLFGIKKENNQDNDSIVPLADMFNYSATKDHTHWEFNSATNAFEVKAVEEIRRGEEIFEGYGLKPNIQYLMFYGFLIPNNNPKNKTRLYVILNKNEENFIFKNHLISLGESNSFYIFEEDSGNHFNRLMGILRIINFEGDISYLEEIKYQALQNQNFKHTHIRRSVPVISLENEKKSIEMLLSNVKERLSKFKETYESDIEELQKNNGLSYNERNALIIRSDEKRILLFYLNFALTIIPLFLMEIKDAYLMSKKILNEGKYIMYLNSLIESIFLVQN